MNLTNQPPYQKGSSKKKANKPTVEQRARWEKIRALGCYVYECKRPPEIHHTHTGGGGRKNHNKVAPLCALHHRGDEGIHTLGRPAFAERFGGTEDDMLLWVKQLLEEV